MAQKNLDLSQEFSFKEFEAMLANETDRYEITFDDGTTRMTGLTVIAYFAKLDPDASVTAKTPAE